MKNECFSCMDGYELLLERANACSYGDHSIILSFFDLCSEETKERLMQRYHLDKDVLSLKMENSMLEVVDECFLIYDHSGYTYKFCWNHGHWNLISGPLE